MGAFANDSYDKYTIGSWYGDMAYFVEPRCPWFVRGGRAAFGTSAGSFSYSNKEGSAFARMSFRIVLTPTNN